MFICKNNIVFDIIPEIECDWVIHTVVQCPKCDELFSIDSKCPAFQTIESLAKINDTLFTTKEPILYLQNSYPK